MHPFPVIKDVDILKQELLQLLLASDPSPVNPFGLQVLKNDSVAALS